MSTKDINLLIEANKAVKEATALHLQAKEVIKELEKELLQAKNEAEQWKSRYQAKRT